MPVHSNLAFATHRRPTSGKWMDFPPRVLIFAACAAMLHYDTFSMAIAAIANLYLGTPLVDYYDDFGARSPGELLPSSLSTLWVFFETL